MWCIVCWIKNRVLSIGVGRLQRKQSLSTAFSTVACIQPVLVQPSALEGSELPVCVLAVGVRLFLELQEET